jgi:hypothetical protein
MNTKSTMHYCLPNFDDLDYENQVKWYGMLAELMSNPAISWIQDLYLSSRAIYISMAMAFVYCTLYLYLMSAFAEPIAWFIVIAVQVGLFALSFLAGGAALVANDQGDKDRFIVMLAVSIISGILAILFLVGLCFGFNSLKTAIDVIDASADFLADTKRIILVPVGYFFLTMIVVGLWLGATLSVFSMAKIVPEEYPKIPQDKDFVYNDDPSLKKKIYVLSLVLFFGMLWIYNFIKAKTSFITMVAASTYYFSSSPEQEGVADVGTGF